MYTTVSSLQVKVIHSTSARVMYVYSVIGVTVSQTHLWWTLCWVEAFNASLSWDCDTPITVYALWSVLMFKGGWRVGYIAPQPPISNRTLVVADGQKTILDRRMKHEPTMHDKLYHSCLTIDRHIFYYRTGIKETRSQHVKIWYVLPAKRKLFLLKAFFANCFNMGWGGDEWNPEKTVLVVDFSCQRSSTGDHVREGVRSTSQATAS